jgi:hypothetical protein
MQIKFAALGAALLIASAAQAAPPSGVTLGPAGSSYYVQPFGGTPANGSGPGAGTVPGSGPGSSGSWSIVYGASPAISLSIDGPGVGNIFLR